MARKKAHEDHANHEAWAIPYGDLVTLLLALFVVLYSMSSVNEGKYRVLSDSLNEAFGGRPRTARPIQIGDKPDRGANPTLISVMPKQSAGKKEGKGFEKIRPPLRTLVDSRDPDRGGERANLARMSDEVQKAMGDLIDKNLIVVRKTDLWLEIEIRTDILFPSGVADVSTDAKPVLARLSGILKPFPNAIRIEGHTDNRPIATLSYPSNWQLSAARAASVVALFMAQGVEPTRMSVAGFGEFHPAASNDTAEGRNHNRRVLIVVLGSTAPLTTTASSSDSAEDGPATLASQLLPMTLAKASTATASPETTP